LIIGNFMQEHLECPNGETNGEAEHPIKHVVVAS
jgi:hypothetical protein